MVQKFKMQIVKESKMLKSKTIRLTTTKGETINFKDIKGFYNSLILKQKLKPEEIHIVGMSPDKMRFLNSEDLKKGHTTLKNMNDDFKDLDDENYYKDKASEIVKFNKFFYVDFIIIRK